MRQKKRLSQLHDFFVIVSARIMPNCITNKTVKYSGKAISNAVSFFESKNNEKIPGTIAEGIEPYSGFLVLKKLIDDEKTRGGNGEFIYATPTLPHAPWVMDRFGKYNPGKGLPLYDAYVEQTHCAINLVVELIKELKRLNRYDNSMIVIHGDHGEGWAGNLVLRNNEVHSSLENKITKPYKPEIQTWGIEHLIERAQPVLMIKLPVASGSFTISDRKSQLIDIYPTVVDALKLPVIEDMRKKIEGVSLIEKSELINQRKRYAYYYPLSITKFKSQVYQLEIVSAGNGINLVPADFESKQFSNLVDFNTPIKFNSSGVSYGYTVSGWSDQEDLHRWTEGGSAVLSLKLPSVPRNDVFFSVVAWPLVIPNKIKSQKISVFVDGTYCSLWDISQEGRYEVRIPKSLVQDKQLTITFRISNPASPKENGMSEDYRKLGIAVKEIIVTEKSLK